MPRKPRHVIDVSNGLALVYPETLSLVLISEKNEARGVFLTVRATLEASAEDLAQFSVAREIRLTDSRLSMVAPSDKDIISFDFVQADARLSGSILLVVEHSALERIKTALATDSGFLSPVYRGNSEEYSAFVTVASARLDPNQVAAVNAVSANEGVSQALLKLLREVTLASGNSEYSPSLVNQALGENGNFSIAGVSPDRRWRLHLPVPLPDLAVAEILQKVDRVTGTSKEIVVKWSE